MARIYVASSWRNKYQQQVCKLLVVNGHSIYDFRNPPNATGFAWKELDGGWESWTPESYREILTKHPRAAQGFLSDYRAMMWADTCVLVLPSGPSSHLEAGWFVGAHKQLHIYMPEKVEPDLMYLMAANICLNEKELIVALNK